MPTVSLGGDRATAKVLVNQPGGGGVVNNEVSCDWRFQPPKKHAKARGTQKAETSFRDLTLPLPYPSGQ